MGSNFHHNLDQVYSSWVLCVIFPSQISSQPLLNYSIRMWGKGWVEAKKRISLFLPRNSISLAGGKGRKEGIPEAVSVILCTQEFACIQECFPSKVKAFFTAPLRLCHLNTVNLVSFLHFPVWLLCRIDQTFTSFLDSVSQGHFQRIIISDQCLVSFQKGNPVVSLE